MKILLNKNLRINKKVCHKDDIVDLPEAEAKQLVAEKKARAIDNATVVPVQAPVKLTVESVKKEFPEVFDTITEEAFKAGAQDAIEELKGSISVQWLKKEFPEVYKSISESGYEEGFKSGVDEAGKELKKSVTADLIEKEFPEVYKAIFSKGAEKKGK